MKTVCTTQIGVEFMDYNVQPLGVVIHTNLLPGVPPGAIIV